MAIQDLAIMPTSRLFTGWSLSLNYLLNLLIHAPGAVSHPKLHFALSTGHQDLASLAAFTFGSARYSLMVWRIATCKGFRHSIPRK
jgi:hypothetical protein